MRNKIKYIPFKNSYEKIALTANPCDNPTEYKNLPDGHYYFRTENKNSINYQVINNNWFFIEQIENDEDLHIHVLAEYNILPNLADKEWAELGKHYNKLSKIWQKNYKIYQLQKYYRESNRKFKLKRFKYNKNKNGANNRVV